MADEQTGTAPVATGGPEGAPNGAAPVAQPIAPKVESQPAAVNWDDPANPYRAKFDGIQGNFKQVKTESDQLKTRLAALEAQHQATLERQAEAQQEVERAHIEALLKGDPSDLQAELKQRLATQEAQRQWERENLPRIQQQAITQARREANEQYVSGFLEALEDAGLNRQEALDHAREVGMDVRAFTRGSVSKAAERKAATLVQGKDAKIAALEEELKGLRRSAEASPDTGTGAPALGGGDDEFLVAFSEGKANAPDDFKRAKRLLSAL